MPTCAEIWFDGGMLHLLHMCVFIILVGATLTAALGGGSTSLIKGDAIYLNAE